MGHVPPPLFPWENLIPAGVLETPFPFPPAHPGITSQAAESVGSR